MLVQAGIDTHLFWLTSRAAGIVALLLASASVGVGLWQAVGRRGGGRGRDLRVTHEALSLGTITAIVIHAGSLLGDSYLKPGVLDLTVPFVSGYQRWWMSLGILAGWSMVALGLAYYARGRIGVARWRMLHRFTALAWVGAVIHSIGIGTDAGEACFLAAIGMAVAPAAALLVYRHLGPAESTPRVAAR